MKTPRLPVSVSSQQTAKRPAFGLPRKSAKAVVLVAIQSGATTASSKAPGKSSPRLPRSAGCSNAKGAPPIASREAAKAGSSASH